MGLTGVRDIPAGKAGNLPDGRMINVRAESTYQSPTLEVYNPINKKSTKIRYCN
jgi:hypothetical protein